MACLPDALSQWANGKGFAQEKTTFEFCRLYGKSDGLRKNGVQPACRLHYLFFQHQS
jgi:hypothetical protein